MFKIIEKEELNSKVSRMRFEAPYISKNYLPGQFVILRVDEKGERIPLTVFNANKSLGTIDVIYQKVGLTTMKLDEKSSGDTILDLVGPLGKPSLVSGFSKAIVVSGGVGSAMACPIAKHLVSIGSKVEIIAGFRSKDLIILEDYMKAIDNDLELVTDDGSNGKKGLVTDILLKKLSSNIGYDLVMAVGPIPMMKAVCEVTKAYGIKTIVSMTSIMIDGTGMCGGCRLTVGNEVKFACIDGPDFDGHLVDFKEAQVRCVAFSEEESLSKAKYCNLFKDV